MKSQVLLQRMCFVFISLNLMIVLGLEDERYISWVVRWLREQLRIFFKNSARLEPGGTARVFLLLLCGAPLQPGEVEGRLSQEAGRWGEGGVSRSSSC